MPDTLTAITSSGFVFPNDLHVRWSLMIVLYPYITGIVAGAFIMSSLYHVFHIRSLEPLAKFSLLFALAFLAFILGKLDTKALWGVTGVPYVIWAIILGLIISNVFGVPKWLKAGVMTEYFIKIGLVCMGAAIFFSDVIKAGAVGMGIGIGIAECKIFKRCKSQDPTQQSEWNAIGQ